MNCREINKISIVEYLTKLGYKPASERRNEYWYLSPLHKERTASFKVNYERNIWFDFALGAGGKPVDFFIHYFKTDIRGVLEKLGSFSFDQQYIQQTINKKDFIQTQIFIQQEGELKSQALIDYIKTRNLNMYFVSKYCTELKYSINRNQYLAIAFKNNSGGYEVRNPYFKGCLLKKDITVLSYRSDRISVFESWSDFIAYLTLKPDKEKTSDYLILNSLSMVIKSLRIIADYQHIDLYLDLDKEGIKASDKIQKLYPSKVRDRSSLYLNHKDVNEYLIQHSLSKSK